MAIPVQNTTLLNTVTYMMNRVNELANNMTLWSVTTDGNTSYTVPVGNSSIGGNFTANTLVIGAGGTNVLVYGANSTVIANTVNSVKLTANLLTVNTSSILGNSTVNTVINSSAFFSTNSTSNIVLTVPTAAQVANGQYYHNANGTWAFLQGSVYSTNTSGLTAQVIDSWPISTYRTVDYVLHVEDNVNNNHTSSRIFAMHDNSAGYLTEYATLTTNSVIGVFSVSTNATSLLLNFTPNAGFTNNVIRYVRTLVT